jgi:uridine phosphorylase
LPGDPGRVPLLAQRLEGARQVAANREFVSWGGELEGAQVTVTSTGIGCPSAAIAVEELHACGTDTFVRVGTAGGMQQNVLVGDLVVAEAAVRDEGTSPQYVPLGFPAVADPDVTLALREGARALGLRHHVGVVHSKDSFYGQREPERMPVADELAARWRAWIRAGVLCSEMEAAAIYVVARSLRARAGGLMLVAGNQELKGSRRDAARLEPLLDGAIEGLRRLIRADG